MTDSEFKKIIMKVKERKQNKISDEEFTILISKVKSYKVNKNKKIIFKKFDRPIKIEKPIQIKQIPKIEETKKIQQEVVDIKLYKKIVRLYEKLINRPEKTVIKEIREKKSIISIAEIEGLSTLLDDMQKKTIAYESYLSTGQGGPGIVFHDNSLSGSGIPGDPLKVISSGGGVNFEIPSPTPDGVNNSFTVLNVPKAMIINSFLYFENDGYTRIGLNITTLITPVLGSAFRSMY